MRAGASVQLLDGFEDGHWLSVQGRGDAVLEADDDLVWLANPGGISGVAVDIFDGAVPDVLQKPGLARAAPHVLVDGVWRLLVHIDGELVPLGKLDGFVASHPGVANWGDHVEVRGKGADPHLEAHLVVAFPGAAVGNRRRAVLLRCPYQVLD